MLRKIRLYGNLAQKYGEEFSFDVKSIGETILALNANFPGFMTDIKKGSFHVVKGEWDNFVDLAENKISLLLEYPDDETFHIMPAVEGAGGDNGWLNIVIGVVLIAATWYAGGSGVLVLGMGGVESAILGVGYGLGVALVLTGISQLLSPTPQVSTNGTEREKDKPSFVFNGPVNRTEQGGPVTIVYGEIITGSIVGGGSIDVEEY